MPKYGRAYTFIYYKDVKESESFYRDLLGLRLEYESDWVTLFWVTDDYCIGAVQSGKGFLKTMDDKPVILCIGLNDDEDIFALYEKLKKAGVKMRTCESEKNCVGNTLYLPIIF
jgi:catechol 2,3-dioxygenase-like lactoylglutathione lyase family enzyme